MFRNLKYILFFIVLAAVLPACEDDLEVPGGPIPDGISTFEVEVGFKDFTPTLDSRASGTAIKKINDLWVVIYDRNGFVEKKKIEKFTIKDDFKPRPDGKLSQESSTAHASFSLTLRNGWYRMFAVANYDLSGVEDTDIDTEEKLRALQFEWSNDANLSSTENAARNAQMFGYFYYGPREENKDEYHNQAAPEVAVRSSATKLHSWLHRAASKVTIAFDTRKLHDNIKIYIRSVAIHDIPKYCYLGRINEPRHADSIIGNGEAIFLANAKDEPVADRKAYYKQHHGEWFMIANGDSIAGLHSDEQGRQPAGTAPLDRLNYEHSDEAPALYFYENMQGQGVRGTATDKRQDVKDDDGINNSISYPNGNTSPDPSDPNTDPNKTGWKDAMVYGSYIEVDGYYVNTGSSRPGRGPIKYRFMLGKDTEIDYNAERNHHYRLTLRFNGHANDVDWHIDYDEEARPGFITPDTAYVSYLYNQPGSLIARATPRKGFKLTKIKAVIVDNEWRPYNGDNDGAIYNKLAWKMQTTPEELYKDATWYDRPDSECALNCEFGFLSLCKVHKVNYHMGGGDNSRNGLQNMIAKFREKYYTEHNEGSKYTKAEREYTVLEDGETSTKGDVDGDYTIKLTTRKIGDETYTDYIATLPLFTRAKSIDNWAVYSGANPFFQHHRYARVKYTAYYEPIDPNDTKLEPYNESSYTVVLQARRVGNPRGIYHRWNNNEPFHVNMMYTLLQPQGGKKFRSVVSDGPWTATIEKDDHHIITLSSGAQMGNTIIGKTNTEIDFNVLFNGVPKDDQANYGAIIKVTYHNNTCVHNIIVRQGYAPMAFESGQVKWSCFNVYDKDNLTYNPLSPGSLFRRRSTLDYPIAEKNNEKYPVGVRLSENDTLMVLGKKGTKFLEIPALEKIGENDFKTYNLYNPSRKHKYEYKIPKEGDVYSQMFDNDNINFGFGIVYGDGATTTLDTEEAYGFYDPKNETYRSHMGMRGAIAYCLVHGDNVFFPFGKAGHHRRKRWQSQLDATKQNAYGMLRYGNIDQLMGGYDGAQPVCNDGSGIKYDNYRPMAYNLRDQEGASYWLNCNSSGNKAAMDFNFGNYMTTLLGKDDTYVPSAWKKTDGLSDAFPLRPVLNE